MYLVDAVENGQICPNDHPGTGSERCIGTVIFLRKLYAKHWLFIFVNKGKK